MSSRNPKEKGARLARNRGVAPPAERRIAGSKQQSATAGQGRGTTSGPGTPSPALAGSQTVARTTGTQVGQSPGGASQQKAANKVRGMGYGSGKKSKPGGTTKARRVVGPKYGPGPGGIGRTGRGAPWG